MKTKQDSVLTPRPELDRFEPYQPGLSIEQIRRQYGLKAVIKLASNENPLGPSRKGAAAYKRAAKNLHRYPESRSVDLRRAVAEALQLDLAEIVVGAGSDDIIEMLAKAYLSPATEIVVSAASFIQYRNAGNLMGARVVTVPMRDMKHDLQAMAAACTERTRFAFVANPNNPTGTYNSRNEVSAFLSALPENVVPVFDEAYFEYASTRTDYPSAVREFFRRRPMVVLRTFSKIYGLAGLRVGYGAAHESIVRDLDKIRLPFNVTAPAQAAAQAALYDAAHVRRSVEHNERERAVLMRELEKLGFPAVHSAANFLLFHVAPLKGRDLFGRLIQKGVIARHVDEYGLPEYLRVTVGPAAENRKFISALREVVATS